MIFVLEKVFFVCEMHEVDLTFKTKILGDSLLFVPFLSNFVQMIIRK